ncbi:auxin-responsive protein SAUR32-like [Ananas comosus]|uniref:Auxin-responsive protein SAUR32-like n=1 Tax=Ananas comosus TaxID=4615 RepID=A0A6P5FKT7_ANACO|nr:auxin-responsive protein SAUR32-like [Ananas comosus]
MWDFRIHKPWRMPTPRGCVAVRVGAAGESRQRFVVPVGHLSHPLFAAMLAEAKREFGFDQKGAIVIPCRIDHFRRVEEVIHRDIDDGAAAAADLHNEHHHHHHHQQHHHQS